MAWINSSTGKTSPSFNQTCVPPMRESAAVTLTGVASVNDPLASRSNRTAYVMSFAMLAGGVTIVALSSKSTLPVAASVMMAPL